MSCCTGEGDPLHCPLIRWPRSSTNTAASPLRACSSVTFDATVTPLKLIHGPLPMRERASVARLPLSASRSTLRYARHVFEPTPAAAARLSHNASAPRRPPRLPVTLVLLVTKKLIVGVCDWLGEVLLLPPHAAAPITAIAAAQPI